MIVITALAGAAWLLYARSQKGRRVSGVLVWLSLPFFALSAMYVWVTVTHAPIYSTDSRFGILSIALSQAVILLALSYFYGGRHGR